MPLVMQLLHTCVPAPPSVSNICTCLRQWRVAAADQERSQQQQEALSPGPKGPCSKRDSSTARMQGVGSCRSSTQHQSEFHAHVLFVST